MASRASDRGRSPRNVLVLNSIFGMGGAERVTYDVVRGLDRAAFSIVFCAFYEPGVIGEEISMAGYRFYSRLMRTKFDLRGLFRLRRIIAAHAVDLIYVAAQPMTLFWTVICAKLCGVRVAALVSNTVVVKEDRKLRSYRWLLPRVDRVITVGERQKQQLVAETGVDPRRVSVVRNGIDMQRFDAPADTAAQRQVAGFAPDRVVVGLVARLVPLKAVDVLLNAAQIVCGAHPTVEFAIVGDGPELERLQQQARTLGLERRVRFFGYVREPAAVIQCFDVAVLCSRTEALPMAILEYMSAAKPCVVTDVGSVRELIDDGVNGFVVEPDDAPGLAAKIACLVENPARARSMGEKGRAVVRERFTIDAMVRNTARIFDEIVSA